MLGSQNSPKKSKYARTKTFKKEEISKDKKIEEDKKEEKG